MRDRVAGAGLECMREGMAEVEDRPPPLALVRVGKNDARLVGGAGADHLRLPETPDFLAGEQARLDDLRHSGAPLSIRQRRKVRRVDRDGLGDRKSTCLNSSHLGISY